MNYIIGGDGRVSDMFNTIGGWTTQFDLNGVLVGGNVKLSSDARMIWHMEQMGGVNGKSILELGPLEGAHTKMMIEAGAKKVIAVEGLSDCFLRCLVVKEAFNLINASFIFGDFCKMIHTGYFTKRFDAVLAAGVLYHQQNPAQLVFDIAKLTNIVMVWSQVASDVSPSNIESEVKCNGVSYYGKINNYGGTRTMLDSYCGGLNNEAFWMYPEEIIRCFRDAGFSDIIENTETISNINGSCLLFIAKK